LFCWGKFFFIRTKKKKQEFKESIEQIDNRGYVFVKNQKEYIKIRLEDKTEEKVDVENFSITFKECSAFFLRVAEVCFKAFANYNVNGKSLLDSTVQKSIIDIAAAISSLSLIHYFKQDSEEDIKLSDQKNSYEDYYSNLPNPYDQSDNTNPSRPHKDTGILTFGVILNVPGLQIWSKKN